MNFHPSRSSRPSSTNNNDNELSSPQVVLFGINRKTQQWKTTGNCDLIRFTNYSHVAENLLFSHSRWRAFVLLLNLYFFIEQSSAQRGWEIIICWWAAERRNVRLFSRILFLTDLPIYYFCAELTRTRVKIAARHQSSFFSRLFFFHCCAQFGPSSSGRSRQACIYVEDARNSRKCLIIYEEFFTADRDEVTSIFATQDNKAVFRTNTRRNTEKITLQNPLTTRMTKFMKCNFPLLSHSIVLKSGKNSHNFPLSRFLSHFVVCFVRLFRIFSGCRRARESERACCWSRVNIFPTIVAREFSSDFHLFHS